MELSIFASTFGLIFMAELGDKTQLAAMTLALRFPWQKVFIGIVAAFATLNLAAVLAGKLLFTLLPLSAICLISAALFFYFGIDSIRCTVGSTEESSQHKLSGNNVLRTTFLMIFMAELGDKSQLMTASQAASYSSTITGLGSVFLASTLALCLVTLIGIFVGKQLGNLIPACWIHRLAGLLFIIFGFLMLARLF